MRKRTVYPALVLLMALLATPLASGAAPARAQEATAEGSELIVGVWPVVALPSVIRFRVRVTVPRGDLAQIVLDIQQGEALAQTFTLDAPDDYLYLDYGSESEYEYDWHIENEPVRLFEEMTFSFQVRTAEGEEASQEETFVLEHQGFDEWRSLDSAHLALYWTGNRFDAAAHIPNLETAFDLLRENAGFDQTARLVVYSQGTQFCVKGEPPEGSPPDDAPLVVISEGEEFACAPAVMTQLYAASGLTPVFVPEVGFTAQGNALTAALFDLAYSARWEGADVPAWFADGLRQLYSRVGQSPSLTIARRASQEDRLLSLRDMEQRPAEDSEQRELWSAQAYLLTLYLADAFGATTPFEIARQVSPRLSLTQAIQQVTGESLARLYGRWTAWLDTPQALAAVAWNPYLPTTPTPAPSDTPTAIPPTHTPLPTATITLTPSSTFRGAQPPAVVRITQAPPTLPRRATNTPLPPGSFNTPTPMPETAKGDEGGGGLCGTGIGAVLLPVIGLALAGRKRKTA